MLIPDVPDLLLLDLVGVEHRGGVHGLAWLVVMMKAVGLGTDLGPSSLEKLAAASQHITGWKRLYRHSRKLN